MICSPKVSSGSMMGRYLFTGQSKMPGACGKARESEVSGEFSLGLPLIRGIWRRSPELAFWYIKRPCSFLLLLSKNMKRPLVLSGEVGTLKSPPIDFARRAH